MINKGLEEYIKMLIDDLKTYKDREIRIKTLEQEKIVFAYDEDKKLRIEQQLREFKFKQSRVENVCSLLTSHEEEVIYNIYMNTDYRFVNLPKVALDFHFCYSSLMRYKQNALRKLESWDRGNSISMKI